MPKRKAPMTMAEVAKLGKGNHRVGGVAGLTLQVTAGGGGRSWTLRYSDATGKRREVGIGSAFEIPLAMARDKALTLRQSMKLDGVDPLMAKQQAKLTAIAEAVASVTFVQAVEGYLAVRDANDSEKHNAQWAMTLQAYAVPSLGAMPVERIAPKDVAAMLQPIWNEKAETARRVRQRVETVIAWADGQAQRSRVNPALLKPMLDAKMLTNGKREVEHHAALAWRELPQFMARLAQAEGVGARALQFAILTAARSGEVRGATWAEVDLDAGEWTVPAERMKAGREHVVALSTAAKALLAALPKGKPSDLIFPGTRGVMSDMTMAASLRRLGVECTPHGFRSSFRDWVGDDKDKDDVLAEMCLAHKVGTAVERAYARSDKRHQRGEMLQQWADFLAGVEKSTS